MSSPPILAVQDIGKRFSGFVALEGISTTFLRNRITAVIGPNGAGKTTFFNVLSGAIKPTTGCILFEGRDLTAAPQHAFAHYGIARSYQITKIFPQLIAHENVRVSGQAFRSRYNIWKNRNLDRDLIDKAHAALRDVGLHDRRDRVARLLSHGEQRALEIAIALVSGPRLLLLDEPTAGMGPEETTGIMRLIERLAADRTILLVEHKMKLILGLSDRILVLHHGRLVADGTPSEIQSDSEVRRIYLGQSDGNA
jgi:branched-chain amino acid transport system ATP-binding protein